MVKKWTLGAIAIALGMMLFGMNVHAKDSSRPIIIPVHNWSSQVVMAYVIGGIFESIGNRVAYTPANSQAVYESIRLGDVTISHEVWQSAFGASFNAARDKGGLLDWGDHEARTLEDMGYPNWVAESGLCPGLPNWEALKNPDCAKNFVTPDSGGKGRWLEGPQDWHQDLIPQRLEALGLSDLWTVKFAGGADALWAELKAAKKEGRGTIIFNWTPNFTDGAGFTFIKFPPYYDGCRPVDGGDGKCGSPDGYLKKAVNEKFPKTHPHSHISFLDKLGHEIGLLEKLDGLEQESRSVLEEHLKKIYFVPEIEEILSVKTTGTTSRWTVVTEEGERSFQVLGRESIDGDKAPAMQITDAEGRRYRITDYWEMDKDSRQVIQELLPDKIVKSKIAGRRSGSSVVMRMR